MGGKLTASLLVGIFTPSESLFLKEGVLVFSSSVVEGVLIGRPGVKIADSCVLLVTLSLVRGRHGTLGGPVGEFEMVARLALK